MYRLPEQGLVKPEELRSVAMDVISKSRYQAGFVQPLTPHQPKPRISLSRCIMAERQIAIKTGVVNRYVPSQRALERITWSWGAPAHV